MRRLFIAFGLAVFLAYCWASVTYQNQVRVPGYRAVTVDVLGKGRTRAQWDADPQAQFRRLTELESAKYQLPEGKGAAGSENPVASGGVPPDRPLTSDDFAAMIARLAPDQGLVMELRDTSDIHRLANRNYLLRDPVMPPGADPDRPPLYNYASPLDKETIDGLLANGIGVVTVTGHGSPVSFEIGTAVMVAIIFLTLLAALKPVLWEPFRIMLDKRRQELKAGTEAARRNQEDEAKLAEAGRAENARLLRELDDLRRRARAEAELAAGEIVDEARQAGKDVKQEGLRRIGQAADSARRRLDGEIPELARLIADALTPGGAPADKNAEK